MLGEFTDWFATMGLVFIILVVVWFIATLAYELTSKIEDWMYDWRVKHRFDKPPTAKCYCRDCRYHDPENHICFGFSEPTNRRTGDGCFCYKAEPRKRKEEVK